MTSRRYTVPTLLVLLSLVSACGPPVLETSSRQDLELSLLKMKEDLDPRTTKSLDAAIGYLTQGAEFDEDESTWAEVLKAYSVLKGMPAKEIIVTAWQRQVWTVEEEVKKLDALQAGRRESQDMLAKLILDDVRLYKPTPGFLDHPVVEAVAYNHTGHRVTGMQLRASLIKDAKGDDPELAVDEWIAQPVFGPFVDDSQIRLRVECSNAAWQSLLATCNHCSFHFEVVTLLGAGNTTLASTEFGKFEEVRLTALLHRLDALHTNGPPLGCLEE